jgi:hypothetical protein
MGAPNLLQRALDDLDGAVHAGAEAARLGQQHLFQWPASQHPDQLHFEGHRLAGQRVVEVEQQPVHRRTSRTTPA